MGTSAPAVEVEFNAFQFEKLLTNLKDSQDSINHCCQWCLQNRQHHKKIVNSWLNVVKRVKIEQRLVLFYLANDVVQYSKRRNYAYVESWGTAIQKATTLVRDEKVKHKILRIFKIWEQRGVYGEDFIADLSGLISVQPTGPKNDEPHEFQASYVINKIKNCANLEKDTDLKLKHLNEHNPKIQISEGLTNSLKDRVHVDDVEKELDVYVQHMEDYINALKLEIKNRIALISVLKQAETQLEADRKDVKLVAHAYKTFGQRVKVFQKKLEEHMEDLPSPVPSPDINAPSPSPDSDLELPDDPAENKSTVADTSVDLSATIQFTNPGYYNPVAPHLDTSTNSLANTTATAGTNESNLSFLSNGFTSFLGQNLSFDITNISASGLFTSSVNNSSALNNSQTSNSYANTSTDLIQPPVPIDSKASENDLSAVYNPLLPPPMPPFSKNNDDGGFSFNSSMEGTNTFAGSYDTSVATYSGSTYSPSTATNSHYDYQLQTGVNPYPPEANYDPSDLPTRWDDAGDIWNELKDCDTPESPPMFEKKGYGNPVEYHDGSMSTGAADVDQRVLPGLGDLDSIVSIGVKDVDHRNLISLTGSPNDDADHVNGVNPPPPVPDRSNLTTIIPQETLWENHDQDYRTLSTLNSDVGPPPPPPSSNSKDQDYRLQFGLDNLTIPPPPPPPKSPEPPPKAPLAPPPLPLPVLAAAPPPPPPPKEGKSPGRRSDNNEGDIDMDLSDDLEVSAKPEGNGHASLEPPPPLPDLLDDVDANQFLDDISNDLNEFSNLSAELNPPDAVEHGPAMDKALLSPIDVHQRPPWHGVPPPMPPSMAFNMGMPPAAMMGGINRMDMNNPPTPGLLPTPTMNGPPPPMLQPPQPPWMDGPPHWNHHAHQTPPRYGDHPLDGPPYLPEDNLPYFPDENPYYPEDNPYYPEDNRYGFDDSFGMDRQEFNMSGGGGAYRRDSFRGGFGNKNQDGFGFRGRGRGNRAGGRGGRGNRRARGRGGFNRGGF